MINHTAGLDSFYTSLSSYSEKELKYGLKALDQKERKFVMSCVQRIKSSNKLVNNFASDAERTLAGKIIQRLHSSCVKCPKKSHLLLRIWKGFLNRIGLRVSSNKVLEEIKGKRLTSSRLNEFLEELREFKEKNPKMKVNLVDFLKSRGYTTKIKNLNFAVDSLTVTPQARLPFGKPPAWGSDLLRNIDISGVTFKDCEFEWVNFSDSRFKDVTFENCNFQYSVNVNASFKKCKFIDCNLNLSCFEDAELTDTTFQNCHVNNTTFYKASIDHVAFNDSSLSGAVFLEAKVKNGSIIKECNLRDCYFFDSKPCFKITGGTANELKRPLMGLLWNHHKAGIAGNKISQAIIRNGGVPFKIHFDHAIDKEKLDKEVRDILDDITANKTEGTQMSIPFQIIQMAKEKNDGEMKKILDLSAALMPKLGGLVLPGGDTDIPPELYGKKKDEIHPQNNSDPDYLRIMLEFSLFNEAVSRGMPVLGICRGCQIANIFFGGDLEQHVTWQDGVQIYTMDDDKSAGILSDIFKKGHVRGFTNHHQANRTIAKPLELVATHGGVPKALESKHGSPVLLTQFHPEFSGDISNFLGVVLDAILTRNNEDIFKGVIDSSKSYQAKLELNRKLAKVFQEKAKPQVKSGKSFAENLKINLQESLLTNDALKHLSFVPNLKSLEISECKMLSEDNLLHLKKLKSIEV